MELKYIESDIGKKKLKEARVINMIYIIVEILIMGLAFINVLMLRREGNAVLICCTIFALSFYLCEVSRLKSIAKKTQKTLGEEICLDGAINLCIYNIEKTKKKAPKVREKMYIYSILNLIDIYIRKGDFEMSQNLISDIESKKMDNYARAYLIRCKASIAYILNNIEEYNVQKEKVKKISGTLKGPIKQNIDERFQLYGYLLENDTDKVNEICDKNIRSKILLNKIVGSYYKGVILEKNNIEEYKKYYKFVAENGNDLAIAKKAREKLKNGTTNNE